MKLPLLLALLAFAAPASASLPTWEPRPGGLWYNMQFTDPNGVNHSLWCNPAECGRGRAGRAPLYEIDQISQEPITANNGAFFPWNHESWQAWRTTWHTKLSHWSYDNATGQAVQGDVRVPARNQEQASATGSLWIVHPPGAQRSDSFVAAPARPQPAPAPERRAPPRRPVSRTPPRESGDTPPAGETPAPAAGRILEFTLFGETGQLVDGRPYEQKESDWLTFAQHREYLATCPQRQGQEPTDTPACRRAVSTARGQIAENLRDEPYIEGKTYRQRYREIITNLPADGAERDNRVTALLSLLDALKNKKYGQPPDSEHEIQLRAEERARLSAAPAGAVTAAKTGAALLQEYETARAALDAADHVGLWQLTSRYRREVPAAGAAPLPPAGERPTGPAEPAPGALTEAERERLRQHAPDLLRAYEQPSDEEAQRAALEAARRWLRDHPTAQEFAAITDEAERRRICDKMRMERDASAGAAGTAAPTEADPAQGSRAQLEGRSGEATQAARAGGEDRDASRVMEGQQPGASRPGSGYRWPPEIIAGCEQLAAQDPGRTTPAPAPQEPPAPDVQPGSANMTAAPLGRPIADPEEAAAPLTSWNPLLNGVKGGLAGAIVGFALGGPLGMLVGALAFGGAAWGLSKI